MPDIKNGLPFPAGMCLSCVTNYSTEPHYCEFPEHCGCDKRAHSNARLKPVVSEVTDEQTEMTWHYDQDKDTYATGDMVPMPAIVFRAAFPEVYQRFWEEQ